MSSRDGRQLIERVLEHLNYERAICRDERDWHAYMAASETCAVIIRNWNRSSFTRKAAA